MGDQEQNLPSTNGTLIFRRSQITVTLPDGTQQAYPLIKEVTRFGRDEDNDVVLPIDYRSISRHHCEIRREGQAFRLVDLQSTNGVLYNGQALEREALLKDGDQIKIGTPGSNQQVQVSFHPGMDLLIQDFNLPDEELSGVGQILAPIEGKPHLRIRYPDGQTSFYELQNEITTIGRNPACELRIPDKLRFVSGRHAQIRQQGNEFSLTDLESSNGTLLNNQPLEVGKAYPLHHGAIIRIGDESFGVSLGLTFNNPLETGAFDGYSLSGVATQVVQMQSVVIGRSSKCDLVLDAPNVSRRHARVQMMGPMAVIEDLHSSNGTMLNQTPITRSELHDGDLIQIGDFILLYHNGILSRYDSQGMRLDVIHLSQEVRVKGQKIPILDRIDMSIMPREFVAIVGSSGAGKSTLLNALIGIRPGKGKVVLNGRDFYTEYEQFRSQLGYVPQAEILHTTLSVEKALDYAARLRLPGSVSKDERERRISAVLETVSMNTEQIRKTRVGNLSGGQRKRVSIAAELLADPKLIFLDEATSGLDPGLEKKLMYTLRRMADEGRTVVLVTHATANIVQTDHVAFLSQGRLIFFGPSQDTLDFFEVEDFADIYEKIERDGAGWQQVFEQDKPANYRQYVVQRLQFAPPVIERPNQRRRNSSGVFFRQLFVLTQRTLNVLASDPLTLMLMLLLFPVTAMLQLVIARPDILTGNLSILSDAVEAAKSMTASYVPLPDTNVFVFVMGLEAVLVGLYVPPNELIRERSIFVRERMVNLKILPYLLSKVVIYAVFVMVQVVIYLLVLSLGVDFPTHGLYLPGVVEIGLTLFLTMMAGIGCGMIVAGISQSTDMAIYVLVMLLFFQFFFAGTVFDLRGNTFEPLSYFSTTRWSLNALGVSVDMQKLAESTVLCNEVPQNPLDVSAGTNTVCFNYPEARDDLTLDYSQGMLLKSWIVLCGMTLFFLLVTGFLLNRIDTI